MSLKCGIVGLPNVGKSTLFNALTKAGIAAENYPLGWTVKKVNGCKDFRDDASPTRLIQDKNLSARLTSMAFATS